MNFKLLIITILLLFCINTTAFAKVNDATLKIIALEEENNILDGYEISDKFKVFVDDKEIVLENGALLFNGRTYLPIRELSTFLGASIDYDLTNKVSILSKNGTTIEIPRNRTKATVIKDNKPTILNLDMDTSIQSLVLNGVTYLPLRFISENLGYTIDYDINTKSIKLKSVGFIEHTRQTTTQTITQAIHTQTTTQNNINASYIANSNTGKLHRESCRYVDKISIEHRVGFSSRGSALASGYTDLCKVCKP